MDRRSVFWQELLGGIGRGCMGTGGFAVDEQGRLIEEYDEDQEEWPEEMYSGDESQDGEDSDRADCVWNYSERGRA